MIWAVKKMEFKQRKRGEVAAYISKRIMHVMRFMHVMRLIRLRIECYSTAVAHQGSNLHNNYHYDNDNLIDSVMIIMEVSAPYSVPS